MKILTILSLVTVFVLSDQQVHSNQITPRPTPLTGVGAEIRTPRPRVMNNFSAPVVRFDGVRLEASNQARMVFSSTDGFSRNRRLYYWVPGGTKLVNTELDGVPHSVIMPEHGKYMIYLYDELDTQADLNGDGVIDQVLLRFYHFDSARHVTLGIPARSGEVDINDPRSKRHFEYKLVDDQLIFSVSPRINNHNDGSDQLRANWQLVDMNQVIYQIIGTPTPTQTPTPTPSNTPIPTDTPEPTNTHTPTIATPSLTPTPTGFPTVPPEMRTSADLNNDQVVDTLDLLLFKMFWRQSTEITPTPTIAF